MPGKGYVRPAGNPGLASSVEARLRRLATLSLFACIFVAFALGTAASALFFRDASRSLAFGALSALVAVTVVLGVIHDRTRDRYLKEQTRTLADLRRRRPEDVEQLVATTYESLGWHTIRAPGGPDGGVDVILKRDKQTVFVQCKHYWNADRVDVRVVRELKGVVAGEGASGGIVMITGGFTKPARETAEKYGIRLLDGSELLELLHMAPRKLTLREVLTPRLTPPAFALITDTCPSCGRHVELRTNGQNGSQFYGCRGYPACTWTKNLVA